MRLPNRLPAEQVGLRSQQTYHEALCVVVPDPRRIVVVAVDVGEARRSESQKGLDEALRARPQPSEGLYGDGEEGCGRRSCARRAVLGLLPLLRAKGRNS